jgi:hypothetical protein
MRFLIRLFAFLMIVYAAMYFFRRLLPTVVSPRRGSARLIKDPVCGTYVAEETAVRANGQFFCSDECRDKFRATGRIA